VVSFPPDFLVLILKFVVDGNDVKECGTCEINLIKKGQQRKTRWEKRVELLQAAICTVSWPLLFETHFEYIMSRQTHWNTTARSVNCTEPTVWKHWPRAKILGFRHVELLTHNLIYIMNINRYTYFLSETSGCSILLTRKYISHDSWCSQTWRYTPIACFILVEPIYTSSVFLSEHWEDWRMVSSGLLRRENLKSYNGKIHPYVENSIRISWQKSDVDVRNGFIWLRLGTTVMQEEYRLLVCYAVWLLYQPKFRRNVSPPSSGPKNRRRFFSPWWRRYVPPKRLSLQEPHGVSLQNTAFFLVTAVKTSKLTFNCTVNRSSNNETYRETFWVRFPVVLLH
jgi:hypothetical protein